MPMELPLISFFDGCISFLRYLTNSTTIKQRTIKRIAPELKFENDKGMVLFLSIKINQNYTSLASISLKALFAGMCCHNI